MRLGRDVQSKMQKYLQKTDRTIDTLKRDRAIDLKNTDRVIY